MKNGENFRLLYDLADKIGAAGKWCHLLIVTRCITVLLTFCSWCIKSSS